MRSEPAAAAGNEADPSEAVRHVTAAIKIDMLQEMIDERIAVRKLKEERIRWKEWNSAATIKVGITLFFGRMYIFSLSLVFSIHVKNPLLV